MPISKKPSYPTRAKTVVATVQGLLPNRTLHAAEIGVWRGETSATLLHFLPNLEVLFLVDSWASSDDYCAQGMIGHSTKEWEDALVETSKVIADYAIRARIWRMTSLVAAALQKDTSLDFIFIDANHAYTHVASDIQAWSRKLKPDGILIGHDWQMESVRRAVTDSISDPVQGGEKDLNYVWWVQSPRLRKQKA